MQRKHPHVSVDRVKELLTYDPLTGVLTWKIARRGKVRAGDVAGTVSGGYISIGIDGRIYRAHRLAFAIMTGVFPDKTIDHRDLDGTHNEWDNIRPATHSQNQFNQPIGKGNTSGRKGAYWDKSKQKWRASIVIDGSFIHLGYFSELDAAAEAYTSKAKKVAPDFART